VLARLLGVAGSPYTVDQVRELIRGVLAAAPAHDKTGWTTLVAPDPSPALVAQLQDLKAEVAADEAPVPADAGAYDGRLADVRAGLKGLGVDGFIVPRADEYQNEYVPACNGRLAWLTGFTGSAGLAIVLAERAAIFVDGRYTLQAEEQVDGAAYDHRHITDTPPETWLADHLKPGQVLGYDAWLLTPDQVARFEAAAAHIGARLTALPYNPLDAAWVGRPAQPLGPIIAFGVEHAGKDAAEKRREIAAGLVRDKRDAAVLTAPESIAWLLNIRGCDVPRTPLPLSYAILHADARVDLFIDRRKFMPGLAAHLGPDVAVHAPTDLGAALDALTGKAVQADPATAAAWVFQRLDAAGAEIHKAADPTRLPKACKNAVELDGIRAAHRRDGVAMARLLAWLDGEVAAGRRLKEIEVSDRLEAMRAEGAGFRDLSFDTISGAGPNGAIVHYHATPESERHLEPSSLYLLDSGGQYLDGTTDITRTLAIGKPSAEMKDRYTRVLKGHIALALAIFPKGTPGAALDVLARQALWQAGLNYDHGTGHGVGHYLSVHEGPQRVHFQSRDGQALLPGMVLSDEPGYYKTGAYGIRIENLVAVVPLDLPGAERDMLHFETLTLCPIDKAPIDFALLTPAEIAWIDAYHERVRAEILPLIEDRAVASWLERATAPLVAG
jgi:Xaa-Pro aminopeptidase